MRCPRTDEIDWARFRADPTNDAFADVRAHYPLCADCSREVSRFEELRRRLAAAERDGHPDEAELLAFDRAPVELTATRQAQIERHVADCRRCRNELAVLEAMMPVRLDVTAPASSTAEGLAARLRSFFRQGPVLATAGLAAVATIALVVVLATQDREGESTEVPRLAERSGDPPAPVPAPAPPDEAQALDERLAERAPAPSPEPGPSPAPAPPEVRPAPTPEPSEQLAREDDAEPESIVPSPQTETAPVLREEMMLAAVELPSSAPVYDPTALFGLGDPGGSRIDVLVRGDENGAVSRVLGPPHRAVSFERSPRLYWHLSRESAFDVELLLVDQETDEALFERVLAAPVAAGLHLVDLAEEGVALEPGRTYLFFASVMPDPDRRDLDRTSGLTLESRPGARPPRSGAPGTRAQAFAEAGSWIDAFATLQQWLDANPDLPRAAEHRAALLRQAGRREVAAALAEAGR